MTKPKREQLRDVAKTLELGAKVLNGAADMDEARENAATNVKAKVAGWRQRARALLDPDAAVEATPAAPEPVALPAVPAPVAETGKVSAFRRAASQVKAVATEAAAEAGVAPQVSGLAARVRARAAELRQQH